MSDRDPTTAPERYRARDAAQPKRRGPPPPLHDGCALFLDIDGTLLDLAPTPESVRVDAGISALLPALAERLDGAIALITGRSMADADRLFRGLSLPIAGQHGLERRAANGSLHRHLPTLFGLQRLRRDLGKFVARHDGLMLEDKGATLALHYRQAPRLASHVHRTLRSHLAAALANETGWKLQPGKGVSGDARHHSKRHHGDAEEIAVATSDRKQGEQHHAAQRSEGGASGADAGCDGIDHLARIDGHEDLTERRAEYA